MTTSRVYSEDDESYYVEFWLLPAKYADGSYTTFSVYLNGDFAGYISPQKGNWQSAPIDDNRTLYFLKGKNVISIGTLAPEIPAVETLKVARNEYDASISSEKYDDFLLNAATNPFKHYKDNNNEYLTEEVNADGLSILTIPNVKLKYTFFKLFNFTKGQDIFMTTSSSEEHNIDMVFFGTQSNLIINPQSDVVKSDQTDYNSFDSITQITPPGPAVLDRYKLKSYYHYKMATSEEMQGLNWKGISSQSKNSSTQIATIHEKIPKTGVYLVRVRHKETGCMGLFNLNVNGTYYYENQPMSFTYVSCSIPADGTCYETFTECKDSKSDDPFLFIHGAGADRIVGFNDDTQSDIRDFLGLSIGDSYLAQQYKFKTSGLSVSSYWSSNPESSCNITTCSPQTIISKPKQKPLENSSSTPSVKMDTDDLLTLNEMSGTLTVCSNTDIRRIRVFDITETRLSSMETEGNYVNASKNSLNLNSRGIYLLYIETSDYSCTKKVVIR